MSETAATYDDLLTVCIQDLHAGETMLRDALPGIASHANNPRLATALAQATDRAADAVTRLEATGRHAGGARNLWMAGIVDDARRDTRSVAPGPLLDAAMIGAIRKAKAAQIVSYETAIAVAAALALQELAETLTIVRAAAVASNRRLARLLPQPGSRAFGKSAQTAS